MDQSNQYNVVELHESSDNKYYEDDFFGSEKEKEYCYSISKRVSHINQIIEEELV